MRSLISALAAAGLLMFTLSCYSADDRTPASRRPTSPAAPARKSRQSKPSTTPTSPAAPARKSRQSSPSPTRTIRPRRRGKAGSQVQARPEQVRPRRRGKAGSQVRRSSREPRPHGREEVSGIQGPLKAPGKKGSDFVWARSSATPPGSGNSAASQLQLLISSLSEPSSRAQLRLLMRLRTLSGRPYPLGATVHPAGRQLQRVLEKQHARRAVVLRRRR